MNQTERSGLMLAIGKFIESKIMPLREQLRQTDEKASKASFLDIESRIKLAVLEAKKEVEAELRQELSEAKKEAKEAADHARNVAAELRQPADGKSVTVDDVTPLLNKMVNQAVSAIPVPQDGKSFSIEDARPLIDEAAAEIKELSHKSIEEFTSTATSKLDDSIKTALSELRQPADGKSVTVEDVTPLLSELVDKAVSAIPVPQDGKSVTVEDITPVLDELVRKAVSSIELPVPKEPDMNELKQHIKSLIDDIPTPKDGVSPSAEAVAAVITADYERRFSDLQLAWERQARQMAEKAIDAMPSPKDGRDALPLESFDMQLSEDCRTVTVKMQAGDTAIEKSVKLPAVIDRGVYSSEKTYDQGDGVTYGGCYWIAQKDSPEGVPGGSNDWRMAVKKGRDGKDLRSNASNIDTRKGVSIRKGDAK